MAVSLTHHLITVIEPTRVEGFIDAGPEHHTPWGIVHGGVYAMAIEPQQAWERRLRSSRGASLRSVRRGEWGKSDAGDSASGTDRVPCFRD
jgi:hypothetical protein